MNKVTQSIVKEKVMKGNIDLSLTHLYDKDGNSRFIEGNGRPATITGFTVTYCKWSLSGTHLMLVLAGTFANGTTYTNGTKLASFVLPNYIMDKIVPVWATRNIERKVYNVYDDSWGSQSNVVVLTKYDTLDIQQGTDFTATSDKKVRIQFDLLIDSE